MDLGPDTATIGSGRVYEDNSASAQIFLYANMADIMLDDDYLRPLSDRSARAYGHIPGTLTNFENFMMRKLLARALRTTDVAKENAQRETEKISAVGKNLRAFLAQCKRELQGEDEPIYELLVRKIGQDLLNPDGWLRAKVAGKEYAALTDMQSAEPLAGEGRRLVANKPVIDKARRNARTLASRIGKILLGTVLGMRDATLNTTSPDPDIGHVTDIVRGFRASHPEPAPVTSAPSQSHEANSDPQALRRMMQDVLAMPVPKEHLEETAETKPSEIAAILRENIRTLTVQRYGNWLQRTVWFFKGKIAFDGQGRLAKQANSNEEVITEFIDRISSTGPNGSVDKLKRHNYLLYLYNALIEDPELLTRQRAELRGFSYFDAIDDSFFYKGNSRSWDEALIVREKGMTNLVDQVPHEKESRGYGYGYGYGHHYGPTRMEHFRAFLDRNEKRIWSGVGVFLTGVVAFTLNPGMQDSVRDYLHPTTSSSSSDTAEEEQDVALSNSTSGVTFNTTDTYNDFNITRSTEPTPEATPTPEPASSPAPYSRTQVAETPVDNWDTPVVETQPDLEPEPSITQRNFRDSASLTTEPSRPRVTVTRVTYQRDGRTIAVVAPKADIDAYETSYGAAVSRIYSAGLGNKFAACNLPITPENADTHMTCDEIATQAGVILPALPRSVLR